MYSIKYLQTNITSEKFSDIILERTKSLIYAENNKAGKMKKNLDLNKKKKGHQLFFSACINSRLARILAEPELVFINCLFPSQFKRKEISEHILNETPED